MSNELYVYLEEGYKWGEGWTKDQETIFNRKIINLADELKASIIIPHRTNGGVCLSIRDYWGELYCHPQDLVGFVSSYQVEKIVNACKKVGLNVRNYKCFDKLNYDKHEDVCEHILKFVNENKDLRKEQLLKKLTYMLDYATHCNVFPE